MGTWRNVSAGAVTGDHHVGWVGRVEGFTGTASLRLEEVRGEEILHTSLTGSGILQGKEGKIS